MNTLSLQVCVISLLLFGAGPAFAESEKKLFPVGDTNAGMRGVAEILNQSVAPAAKPAKPGAAPAVTEPSKPAAKKAQSPPAAKPVPTQPPVTPQKKTPALAPEVGPATPPASGVSGLLQAVPRLKWTMPKTIERRWIGLSRIADPRAQAKAFARSKLLSYACRGLVDFRQLVKGKRLRLSFRDSHRGRSWADPLLAKTLIRALKKMRRTHRDVKIMVGDISQPGCGPLYFGTLVRFVRDTPEEKSATALINSANLLHGEPTAIAIEKKGRKNPRKTERTILAHEFTPEGHLNLKVADRRYVSSGRVKQKRVRKELKKLDERLPKAVVGLARRVKSYHAEKGLLKRWKQVFIWPKRKRKLVVFARWRVDPMKPLTAQLRRVTELRFARYNPRKPGGMRDEIRWVKRKGGTVNTSRWERWRLLREAGHQTHVSGRDADLSYANLENRRRFMHAVKLMDIDKTWTWFKTLEKSARWSRTYVEGILVSGRVKRTLKRGLDKKAKKSHLFRKIVRRVSGHGAHHHVRVRGSRPVEAPVAVRIWKRVKAVFARLIDLTVK